MTEVEINGVVGIRRGDIVSALIPINLLEPTAWNPNEMTPAQQAMLRDTIKEYGFLDPLSVVPLQNGKFSINSGEHRWNAARELGMKEVPCDIMWDPKWQSEELQQFQSVKFNSIHGKMNPDKMVSLYKQVADKHGPDKVAALMGYTEKNGLEKIIKQVSQQLKETLPKEVAEKFEHEAKQAKTVADLHKIIPHIFEEHGDTLQFSFLVFTFGGKDHIYIAMDKDVRQMINKIMNISKTKHIDINKLLLDALMGVANSYSDAEIKDDSVKF